MSNEIILTGDGSHSLHSSKYNAAYHSHYGAIDESITIFISGGLHYLKDQAKLQSINVFEMGFGSGLNAFLSAIFADQHKILIKYDGLELHPLKSEVVEGLNFTESVGHKDLFNKIQNSIWQKPKQITENFELNKLKGDILDYQFNNSYDLIIFDAFAPSCQPQLWEIELHQKIYQNLNQGGCLLTYCAKGVFKRMLKSIGYRLEMLPGPAKKKEITRAIKI